MRGSTASTREVLLGAETIQLTGVMPQPGDRLTATFRVPAARHARSPLTGATLRDGPVLVSTLPNIGRNACIRQIVGLEEAANRLFPDARLFHVSSDAPHFWNEVDEYHGDMEAPGYTLHGATPRSRRSFCDAFGVGVVNHHRIAHGLFALLDGVFLAAEIPKNQMLSPEITGFVTQVRRALADKPSARLVK